VNKRGDLFVADPCKRQVFVVRDGKFSLVGGTGADHEEPAGDGGPATAASFDEWKMSLDEKENLLISGPVFGHIYRISQDGRFSIIAGSGLWGVTRDATPARQALFQEPFRLAVDGAGNIFMTDLEANRIYRLDRKGMVSQVAGYGPSGYDGEDTPARNYRLNGPHDIRASPNGSIVFADHLNNRVREVTADGRLRTVAGNGRRGYSGDGGRALDAELNFPTGVCLDRAGNIYIADTDNNRVRKVTPDGTILTVAGNGTAGYSGDGGAADQAALDTPRAVEVDPNGDLYIADMRNRRIRRVSAGVITTLAGDGRAAYSGDGGLAVHASLALPGDLAVGADRQLYILDRPTHRIRRIDLVSGIITTFAGNGDSIASGDGGPPTKAGLGDPGGITVDAAGNVYVTDQASKQLRIIRPVSHN
jgi:trimeric autotransporter adhesin